MMSDTPERICDHAASIRQYAQRVRSLADALTEHAEPITIAAFGDIEDDTTAIEQHADAFAADLARVVAYARELETIMAGMEQAAHPEITIDQDYIDGIRGGLGVADLMRDSDRKAR